MDDKNSKNIVAISPGHNPSKSESTIITCNEVLQLYALIHHELHWQTLIQDEERERTFFWHMIKYIIL